MSTFATGGPSVAGKLFNPNGPQVKKLFNPFQSQNLWRSKLVEVVLDPASTTLSAAGTADYRIYFPKDEFLDKCWISRIDFVNTYFNTGVELTTSRNLLFYGPFSIYMNLLRGQEFIVNNMPLQFCQFEGQNNIFRNAYPFRIETERSYLTFKSYDPAINTLLVGLPDKPQSLLFQFWYLPVESETNDSEVFNAGDFRYNPYRDQNWFRLKFSTVKVPADPGNLLTPGSTVKCPLKYDSFIDKQIINRIVSLDPANLGPVSPTSPGWQIGPDNEKFYNNQLSAYLSVTDKNAVILDRTVLEYTAENNQNGGYRNMIPFNVDTARSFIEVSSRGAVALKPSAGDHVMLGYYYLPEWLKERLMR